MLCVIVNGEGNSEGTKPSETEQLQQQRVVSIYQSTCQRALGQCQSDGQCRRHLVLKLFTLSILM